MDVSLKPQQQNVEITTAKTSEEQLKELQLKMDSISKMFFMLRKTNYKKNKKKSITASATEDPLINTDGIPVNTCYIGYTKKSSCPYILVVNDKGKYVIGSDEFASLSSAAEFVSGVKRSGWTFWKTLQGDTLKELYR